MGVIRSCTSVLHHLIKRCFLSFQQSNITSISYHHLQISHISTIKLFSAVKVTAVRRTGKPNTFSSLFLSHQPLSVAFTTWKHSREHHNETENLHSKKMSKIVPKEEMVAFMVRVMTKVGVSKAHAASLADCLVTGDYRGHYSHGLNRLGKLKLSTFTNFNFFFN